MDVIRRRVDFFRQAGNLIDRVEHSQCTIWQLARARQELSPDHPVAGLLFFLRIQKNEEREKLQKEVDRACLVNTKRMAFDFPPRVCIASIQ
ncbi:hypothetical protein K435DRAFT_880779 [Dendrothele bispora CBS 962.96]|uniref:Uncharacterized protein n=1 Tax=Dendrothele bispora (strain CBS 962.96) TaxID=1314807 RepID=A0A4S8KJE0_DENBC|nr:hypothetical protein K435DRAFT_880779 [Dendrothele bispora CBS 962.96]